MKSIYKSRRYLGLSATTEEKFSLLYYHADLISSLTNHTVNIFRDFWEVFVGFQDFRQHIQDFRQNKLSPARPSAFFMYTMFFVKNYSCWRNIGFSVENTVENTRWMRWKDIKTLA